ncbi:MAG: sugar ABC transporter substrate-binding protein [Oscillospiraceae bacterium]
MKKQRLLAAILGITMLFSACGSKPPVSTSAANPSSAPAVSKSEPAAAEPMEIEFWTINLKKNFEGYIQGMIDDYQAKNPNITINWVDVPGKDVTQKMVTAMAGDKVPNVINETNLGFATVKSQNALAAISDYATKEQLSVYTQSMLEPFMQNGKLMAIPWYHEGGYVQFINTELYKKAGLDADKPPKTFEELLANGKIIHEKMPNVYGSNDFPSMIAMQAEGLPIISEDGKSAVFTSDAHVKFVQMFVDGYKNGAIAPGAIGKDNRAFQQSFDSEQVAQWGWWFSSELNNWEKNAPDVYKKVKVYPAVTGKAGAVPVYDSMVFLVPAKAEHPKETVDFLLYITNPENQLAFCKLAPIFPSTPSTLEDPFFQSPKIEKLQDEATAIRLSSAGELRLDIVSTLNSASELTELYNEEIRAALVGDKTAKQALEDAAKAWAPILAKG